MARDIMREISAHIDDYNDESYFHEKEKDANLAEFFSGKAGGTSEIYDALEEALQKDGKVTLSSSVIKEIEKHIDDYNDEVLFNKRQGNELQADFYSGKSSACVEILDELKSSLEGKMIDKNGEIVPDKQKTFSLKPKIGRVDTDRENDGR